MRKHSLCSRDTFSTAGPLMLSLVCQGNSGSVLRDFLVRPSNLIYQVSNTLSVSRVIKHHSIISQIYHNKSIDNKSRSEEVLQHKSLNMSSRPASKTWGGKEFWGMSWEYDPQWLLNEEQRQIQAKLIETCRTVIRPNAVSYFNFFLVLRLL